MMRERPCLLLVLAFVSVACASPPPPSAPAPGEPVATTSPSGPATSAPTAPVPSAKGATPTGSVTFQQVLDEGIARLKLLFSNPTARSCRLDGYTVTWGGDRHKTVTIKDLVIPPGETRDRWIKLEGEEIAAARAPMDSLSVTLKVDCGGS